MISYVHSDSMTWFNQETLRSPHICVDASLSYRASIMVDAASGLVVASESQLSSDLMILERWALNLR